MLDFEEVSRRIEARNDDCAVSHECIVAPLVGQLLDPEYHGENRTVLLTASECIKLGKTLERQAQLLDQQDDAGADRGMTIRLRVNYYAIAALWLSAVLVARW